MPTIKDVLTHMIKDLDYTIEKDGFELFNIPPNQFWRVKGGNGVMFALDGIEMYNDHDHDHEYYISVEDGEIHWGVKLDDNITIHTFAQINLW
jgi:hypothetical protein